ncbi:MAG: zinc ABC transporter substrate-binding protein [Clostridia bacterium]|nr:zinc ABC transporter substrate-binding protein [Clostridia bacterium]
MKRTLMKLLGVLLSIGILTGAFAACSNNTTETADDGKLDIVTTIFPVYDWVTNVLGDKVADANVTMLLDKGVDLHSYQPTAADIAKIATCDVFVYVGGESDEWVADALNEATNKNMQVVNLMEVMGDRAKAEEMKEGMQETEHDHEHEEGEEHAKGEEHEHEEGEAELDEHVWLSLKNASFLCDAICTAVSTADEANADTYKTNTASYKEKLAALDGEYKGVVDTAKRKTVLFGDRFPFRYMVEDYGLDYYAAFVGCSAETEASFETISFLANKVDELGITNVFIIDNSDSKIAETILKTAKSNNGAIRMMDSLQSTTAEEVANGKTYLSAMQKNLEVLKVALN